MTTVGRQRPERRFYFRLAAHLGLTVGELLARISSHELTEWAAYEREFGPLGPERGDIQAALVAHTTAVMLGNGKGKRPKLTDFVLRWKRDRGPRQTGADQLNIFRALAARQEGRKRVDNR